VKEIRIVEIEGFDKTPCKDPHVENTSQIGHLARATDRLQVISPNNNVTQRGIKVTCLNINLWNRFADAK